MNLDPTGQVRPNFQKTAPQRTQHATFEPWSRLPSSRKAAFRRHGFLNDVIERILGLYPAPNGECRMRASWRRLDAGWRRAPR